MLDCNIRYAYRLLCLLCILLLPYSSFSQSSEQSSLIDSLWSIWLDKEQIDIKRLQSLDEIIWDYYLFTKPDSAIILAKILEEGSIRLSKNHPDTSKNHIICSNYTAISYNLHGIANYLLGNKDESVHYYEKALALSTANKNESVQASALSNLQMIYTDHGDYSKATEYAVQAFKLDEKSGDPRRISQALNTIGTLYHDQKEFDTAKGYFENSIKQARIAKDSASVYVAQTNLAHIHMANKEVNEALELRLRVLQGRLALNDSTSIADALNDVGEIYNELGESDKAIDYYLQALNISRRIKHKDGIIFSLTKIAKNNIQKGEFNDAIKNGKEAYRLASQSESAIQISKAADVLYTAYKAIGRDSDALKMHETFIAYRDSINNESNQREVIRHEYKYAYEKQALLDSLNFSKAQEIKDLKIDKQNAKLTSQRIVMGSTGLGLLLIIALAFSIYQGKKRSDVLLLNILPEETAKELKAKGSAQSKLIDEATILFTDFKGFTEMSIRLSAAELVEEIHERFTAFDHVMEKYGIEKIKTIGDAYMAAGGLPSPKRGHETDVVNAAIEIQDFMIDLAKKRRAEGQPYFEMRVGIHTGPVVAGIVGIKKFQYDIWGDTVNIAARMESHGETGKVNISSSTYSIIKDDPKFSFESRGKIHAKGKGEIEMYFVQRNS